MRVTMKHLALIAAAAAPAACQDYPKDIAAPSNRDVRAAESTGGPVVRITSPITNDVVAVTAVWVAGRSRAGRPSRSSSKP